MYSHQDQTQEASGKVINITRKIDVPSPVNGWVEAIRDP
jgi:hypothetical protein